MLTFSESYVPNLEVKFVGAADTDFALFAGELDFLVPNVLAVSLMWFSRRSFSSLPGTNPS